MAAETRTTLNPGSWGIRLLWGGLFWASILKAFLLWFRIRKGILKTKEPVFNTNFWRSSPVYIRLQKDFNHRRAQNLAAGVYIQRMVRLNPFGSLPLAVNYLSNDLQKCALTRAVLRMVLAQTYRFFLQRMHKEGLDEVPIQQAIEKISKA